MVAQQHVLDSLKQIGLNLYERKIWVSLLSRGSATAGELSSLAKVPHSRTYDILESLADKGFVVIQTAKPLKYMAMAPGEALERAKRKVKEDSEISTDRISQLQGSPVMKELEKIYKNGVSLVEPSELTGALKGRNAMHAQLETLFKGAKSQINVITTAQGVADMQSRHGEFLKKAASKGVKVKIAAPHTKESAEALNIMKSYADVRKISKNDVLGRVCIIDNNHIVIALTDDKSVHPTQDLALWTQSQHVASGVMGPMFNVLWDQLEG